MTDTVNVLVTLPLPEKYLDQLRGVSPRLNIQQEVAKEAGEISDEIWQDVEVLYTDQVLPPPEKTPALRWVQFHYAGVEHALDAPILQQEQVKATTLSGAAVPQMAEYVLMMLLALGRHLPLMLANKDKSLWPQERWEIFMPLELRKATVGIVGYGSIGREVARLLTPLGTEVLATKRDVMNPADSGYVLEGLGDPEGNLARRLYPPQALRSMVKECDFVVITVPLTGETRSMFGEEEFEAMKKSAYLVDVSRGGVVDHEALIDALKSGGIAGAALDVFPEEPLPEDSPLWKMPNVIISPHVSGITRYYDDRAVDLFSENLHRYLAGLPLFNRVNMKRGY